MKRVYEKFGDMDRDDQLELFDEWLDDADLQMMRDGEWVPCVYPSWDKEETYRVQPGGLGFFWGAVPEHINYVAMDDDGKVRGFEDKPTYDETVGGWFVNLGDGGMEFVQVLTSGVLSEESLDIRPGFKS